MGRITIDGEQVQYSTRKEIAPELWDSHKGRCKGTGEETKEINRYLQTKEEQANAHSSVKCNAVTNVEKNFIGSFIA